MVTSSALSSTMLLHKKLYLKQTRLRRQIPCVGDTVVTPVKAGQTCDDEVDVARCKLRIARCKGSEIKKYKTGDCGASVSVEVPLSELFHKELATRTSEHLRDRRGQRRMMMMRIIWNDPLSDLSQLKVSKPFRLCSI